MKKRRSIHQCLTSAVEKRVGYVTLRELSRCYRLRERLRRDERMLASFEAKAYPSAQVLTGMPPVIGIRDKVGDLAAEIADLKEQIAVLQRAIVQEEQRLEVLISGIEDDQTRMIFRLRFLRCLTWGEVAEVVGGRNTEQGVKAICYRYLKGCSDM